MSKRNRNESKRIPKVRIAQPKGRCFQLRYQCPDEGREIRIGTGTHLRAEAEQQKKELEAKLLLGLKVDRRSKSIRGPEMSWEVFREEYRRIQLKSLRPKSLLDAESRLDIAERIVKPRTLGDLARADVLHELQAGLLAGLQSRFGRPRSAHTVKSHMKSILAALNWAKHQEWIEIVPRVRTVKTSKLKAMKGRPITEEEFQRMLDATESVVGKVAAESWRYVLRGLWASALRIDELMNVSWDDGNAIRPVWKAGKLPTLFIPDHLQKNDTEEEIPLLPWFEEVLLETSKHQRIGWVFTPNSLQTNVGRRSSVHRPDSEWVAKIISRIGKVADVVVAEGDDLSKKPTKYVSAHDLRRSCAQRLMDAGVPALVTSRILRHASIETTLRYYVSMGVQKDSEVLQRLL